MNISRTEAAARLQKFVTRWMQKTVPTLERVSVDRKSRVVKVKDALGWRDVGTIDDYLAVARASGLFN